MLMATPPAWAQKTATTRRGYGTNEEATPTDGLQMPPHSARGNPGNVNHPPINGTFHDPGNNYVPTDPFLIVSEQ
jgi:hypothetical protein